MRHPCLTWWPEKFFGDTAHVSPEAAAFYMVLLSHAWLRGGSLPNDDAMLRNMTRLSRQKWYAIRDEVMSFWHLAEDGCWHQKRLDVEWSRASEKHVAVQRASHKVDELNGKKPDRLRAQKANKNNGQQFSSARARDPTPTPTEKNSAFQAESSSLAPASLRVRSHASPALRLVGNTEPSRPPDEVPVELPEITAAYRPDDKLTPAERVRIADEIVAKLAAEIARDKLIEPRSGTFAELERKAAEEKLATLAADKPMLALSPTMRASRLLASAETAYVPENGNAADAQG